MTKELSKAKKVSESFVLDHVRSIDPYQPGKPVSELCREYGLSENKVVKLASNESPIGPTPEFKKNLKSVLKKWEKAIIVDKNFIKLNQNGFLFADAIAIDLMI